MQTMHTSCWPRCSNCNFLHRERKWMNKKTSWVASFGFCCMATPRLGVQELDSKSTSLLNRMLQWSRKRRCIVASWSPRAARGAYRTFVRCWFAANVNVQTQLELICPSIGIACSPPPCLPVLALPARSMLIYAHIFVDNLRDLIARRAAANCYLVRQLICQKIDSPLSEAVWPVPPEQRQLEQHLLPLADFGLVCRCRNFHLDRLPNCCKVKFALCLLQCPEVCIQYAYLDTKYNRLTYLTHLIRQRTATTRPSYLCSVRNKELPFTLMRIVRPSCPSSAQSFANLHFKARQIEQRQH